MGLPASPGRVFHCSEQTINNGLFENSCHCSHLRCFIVAMCEQTLKLQYNIWRPSESVFLIIVPRFTKKILLFEVSQVPPLRLSSKSCVYVKIITEHCWNGNDGGNPNYRDETSSQCNFVYYKYHTDWPEIRNIPQWWEAEGWAAFLNINIWHEHELLLKNQSVPHSKQTPSR